MGRPRDLAWDIAGYSAVNPIPYYPIVTIQKENNHDIMTGGILHHHIAGGIANNKHHKNPIGDGWFGLPH